MDVIKLGLGGFGTVGSGLAKILKMNAARIEKRLGKRIEISSILVRDLKKKRAVNPGSDVTFTDDLNVLVNDPNVDIVVELMGGLDTARELMLKAFAAGKHVVTANKHLLAEHGLELFEAAHKNSVGLMFEASCAGGIPIVQTLKESLAGDEIINMLGIMNGTANYILSEMTTKGVDFQKALADAQDLGYAEADPTFDIEGFDTAHKLCVLIRMAYGMDYPLAEIPIQGITSVTPMDIEFAREFGYRIKLLAHVMDVNGRLEAGVHPALVPYTYLLARVGGNYNAVRLEGNAVGPIMLHGQGAGDLPTGSAVLADIMNLIRKMDSDSFDNTGFTNQPISRATILPPEESESKYYFRFTVADRTGVMASITRSMADHGISIAQAVQKGEAGAEGVPMVIITHETAAKDVDAMITEVDAMDFSVEPCVKFRIL
ncbi:MULTISPECIES: homoserine dehydrogenase [unclassified Pseudodesulfovibrio]|uniref:homoserine dehydrogenase n=1 Tax=unclassified Pseudodesulfovibrio TaxID=2661612 RepID=UPI000FEBE5AD|nr:MULTISPECIES: homoserine dehydrogenase [unclassified Pseudodesulfovibrio]MCJ2163948.1 homoserine dehydrogenase [Pseudodesulfovibrio sp. S3-i]RWU05807.1 homoserine dehydrogenase [Pseudodesulfovibrio sp. S3]